MQHNRPRVWPSLLVGACLVPVLGLLANLLVLPFELDPAWGLVAPATEPDEDFLLTRLGFLVTSFVFGALLLAALGWLVRNSQQPVGDRLGLVRGRLSIWAWPLLAMGSMAVNWIGVSLVSPLFDMPSDYGAALSEIIGFESGDGWLLLVIAVAVLPAITEELVFRGYVQTRLAQRFPAWVAVGISSVFFAMAHGELQYGLLVLPLGLWFGFVAYLAESTWPSIFLHFVNNAFSLAVARVLHGSGEEVEAEPWTLADAAVDVLPVAVFPALIVHLVLRMQRRATTVIWNPNASESMGPR